MWIKLILSIILPVGVGSFAGWATRKEIKGWYADLVKPSFNPPNWIFAPVWTTLYVLMGIALFLVWKNNKVSQQVKRSAIVLFFVQLFFNFWWSIIFFYLHSPGWAFVEIILMWSSIALTIYWFAKVNRLAAALLVPYLLWVSFAAVLNFYIWQLN